MAKKILTLVLLFFLLPCTVYAEVSTQREYDDQGRCILEMYFEDGEPYFYNYSYYGLRWEYDGSQTVTTFYLDKDGSLIKNKSGYSKLVQTLDEAGHAVQDLYFDKNGQPAARWSKECGVRRTAFDDRGNCTEFTYINKDGEPMMISSGYATVRRTFNDQSKVDVNMYFDLHGAPAQLSLGQYGDRHTYEDGEDRYITYLGIDGQPICTYSGYTTARRTYTGSQINIEWYYGMDGQPMQLRRGQYGSHLIYKNGIYSGKVPVNQDGDEIFFLDLILGQHLWLVVLCAAGVIAACAILPKRGKFALLVLYVLFIFYMTLYVREVNTNIPTNNPLFHSVRKAINSNSWTQIIDNILLFVPLGFLAASCRRRKKVFSTILACTLLSVFVELAQYFTRLGWPELDDVIWNTLGACLGTAAAILFDRLHSLSAGLKKRR